MKIRPLGPELLHADGQADRRDECNSRFSQFCNSAWKWGHFEQNVSDRDAVMTNCIVPRERW